VIRVLLASLVAVAALAVVPAAAQAQDASCSQYCDPLGGGHHHSGGGGGGGHHGGGGGHNGSSASGSRGLVGGSSHAPSSAAALHSAGGTGGGSSDPAKHGSSRLPLTGFDVVSVLLAGYAALGAGLALLATTARRRA
jgi:hypothetical protein